MWNLNRRQSLAALLGGGLVSLTGVGLLSGQEKGLIQSILNRVVGRYEMEETEFDAFVSDLDTPRGNAARVRFAMFRAFSATDPDTLLRFAPTSFDDRYRAYERRVVTNFITKTDFITKEKNGPVSFIGEPACRNPFAKFDMT